MLPVSSWPGGSVASPHVPEVSELRPSVEGGEKHSGQTTALPGFQVTS